MKEHIIYRKVFIHGEEDLPKEKGFYFVHWKHPDDKIHTQMSVQFYDESIKGLWFGKDWYDWYLLPVPLPSDEDVLEPIQNALYATHAFSLDDCTGLASGILSYLKEAGFAIVRGNDR